MIFEIDADIVYTQSCQAKYSFRKVNAKNTIVLRPVDLFGLVRLTVPNGFLAERLKPDFDRLTLIPPALHLPRKTLREF